MSRLAPNLENPVRIAFAGGGFVSELHAAAIARSRDAVLVGIFDPDRALAERRAREWGGTAYHALESLLDDPDVDAVFVLTPTAFHVDVAIRALDAGKHVLVEKPIATGIAELERLIARAATAETICMAGHNYAYIPELQRIARLIHEGHLGEIRLLSILFAIAHDEEVAAHYEGVMRLVMPHHVYLATRLLGVPMRVHAGVTDTGWQRLTQDDQAWIALDYLPRATGLLFATLAVGDDSADPWTFVVKVLGTHGSASATWRGGVFQRTIGSISTGYAAYEESYEHELDAFCRAARGDAEAVLSRLEDARDAERILQAAELAARDHLPVDLDADQGG